MCISDSSNVVYDREGSSFATLRPGMIDWEKILSAAGWFHWSGIAASLSQEGADTCLEAFPDYKCKATVYIVIHQSALRRILSRILAQTVLERCVVGRHFNDGTCLVKKDAGCLLLLGKTDRKSTRLNSSHEIPSSMPSSA